LQSTFYLKNIVSDLVLYMADRKTTIINITGNVNSPITVNNSSNYWLPTDLLYRAYDFLPNKERVGAKVIATVASGLVQTNCLPVTKPPCFGDGNSLAYFYLTDGFTENTVSEGANITSNGPEYMWVNTGYKGQHPSLQTILEIQDPTKVNYISAGNAICDQYKKMSLSANQIQMLVNRFAQLATRYSDSELQKLYYATILAGLRSEVPFGTPFKCPVI